MGVGGYGPRGRRGKTLCARGGLLFWGVIIAGRLSFTLEGAQSDNIGGACLSIGYCPKAAAILWQRILQLRARLDLGAT